MEVTNKTLSILLLALLVISIGTTFYNLEKLSSLRLIRSPTGFILNPASLAKVNISTLASLRFSIATVDWGTGYVNTTGQNTNCSMAVVNQSQAASYMDPIAKCVGFLKINSSLQIEDDGNTNLTLSIGSNADAASLIGGTGPWFKFQATNNESGSCPLALTYPSNWTDVVLASPFYYICNTSAGGGGLSFLDTQDSMNININISIPYNSLIGLRQATLTVTGTAI